jgi:hypothetical protein
LWFKNRSGAYGHKLQDIVRGVTKTLSANDTRAEETHTSVASFDSGGFSLTGSDNSYNSSSHTYVAWNWKANGAGVSNTSGDITSTVSANADAGFSIVKYTGNGVTSLQTIGHGLSKAPEMIIKKWYNDDSAWYVYHTGLTSNYYELYLNDTNAQTAGGFFQRGMPNATTFTAYDGGETYQNIIAYCFHSVAQYSKVFSYTGNGSTDGTFVYCDFRPAYVMIKRTDIAGDWYIWDAVRNEYNLVTRNLVPNKSNAEFVGTSNYTLDFTSNGFKHRGSGGDVNASGGTYIGIAFAEHPFKYSTAR